MSMLKIARKKIMRVNLTQTEEVHLDQMIQTMEGMKVEEEIHVTQEGEEDMQGETTKGIIEDIRTDLQL